MNIGNLFEIVKNRGGELWTNIYNGEWRTFNDDAINSLLTTCQKVFRSKYMSYDEKIDTIKSLQARVIELVDNGKLGTGVPSDFNGSAEEYVETIIQKLINFFSEFDFEPNFRFINSFSNQCKIDYGKEYVISYFKLTDNTYINEISQKVKSKEFSDICDSLKKLKFNKVINTRFKLYYGSQGTGKTTLACKEANNNVMVCHSAMLPQDLMEDFQFSNGQPSFTPSVLQNAIVNGDKIVLDEINLLPFESLRFLQSILDGKTEFIYKGKTIKIHKDFQIIGTMNLIVNGSVYSLPEPLVDRSSEFKEFKLTANALINAII